MAAPTRPLTTDRPRHGLRERQAAIRTIVYVSHADGREVRVLELNPESGNLAPIEQVAVTGRAMPMAVSPDRRRLHVGLRSEPFSVAGFRIDSATGRLTALATQRVAADLAFIAADRGGRFLLGASFSGHQLAIHPIGPDGVIRERPVQIVATPPGPHSVLAHPSNRCLYVACLGGDIVLRLEFDPASGALRPGESPGARTPPGAGPRHLRIHPNGAFLYVLNETDGTVCVFVLDSRTGEGRLLETVDAKPPGLRLPAAAADIQLTPDGRFLYSSIRASSTIAGFAVDAATGRLAAIGHWPTEAVPRGFAIDPRGRFLLAAGQESDGVATYRIDHASGRLDPVGRTAVGRGPNWIEIVELP
jgi:6-phosphogluconolactonase